MNSTKAGLIGILLLILGVLLFFVALNYFNIISLSQLYPNQLGWLPHAQTKIGCPVEKQLCLGAQVLRYPGTKAYQGLGWNLPKDYSIKAVFDGKLIKEDITGPIPSLRVIRLTSNNARYGATYVFTVDRKLEGSELRKYQNGVIVKKNEIIDRIAGNYLQQLGFSKTNLQFYTIDKKKKLIIRLNSDDLNNKALSL